MPFHLISYQTATTSIQLRESAAKAEGPQNSIIIGPNGSGKSMILSQIMDDLDFFHSKILSGNPAKQLRNSATVDSALTYEMDGTKITLVRIGSRVKAFIDDNETDVQSIPFPKKAIAVAHLPVDRFKFSRQADRDFYAYLGLRQATNLTTTGALEVKVAAAFLKGASRPGFRDHVLNWLNILELGPKVSIAFDAIELDVFNAADGSRDDFLEKAYFFSQRRSGRLRSIELDEFSERYAQDVDAAIQFFAHLRAWGLVEIERSNVVAKLDAFDSGLDPVEALTWLEGARRLRLLPIIRLELDRGDSVGFSQLSSGEQQILGTMVRVLSEIEPYSVIAIDEPEVSLHPSWQQQYVPSLQRMLRSFPNTHVLIATHSHFMVSDVHEGQSTLVVASKGEKQFELFEGKTYGRSAENILYRVFGVGAASNSYLEQELTSGLQMISGAIPADHSRLLEIVGHLKRATGPDNRAMGEIVKRIENFLEEQE